MSIRAAREARTSASTAGTTHLPAAVETGARPAMVKAVTTAALAPGSIRMVHARARQAQLD